MVSFLLLNPQPSLRRTCLQLMDQLVTGIQLLNPHKDSRTGVLALP